MAARTAEAALERPGLFQRVGVSTTWEGCLPCFEVALKSCSGRFCFLRLSENDIWSARAWMWRNVARGASLEQMQAGPRPRQINVIMRGWKEPTNQYSDVRNELGGPAIDQLTLARRLEAEWLRIVLHTAVYCGRSLEARIGTARMLRTPRDRNAGVALGKGCLRVVSPTLADVMNL